MKLDSFYPPFLIQLQDWNIPYSVHYDRVKDAQAIRSYKETLNSINHQNKIVGNLGTI